MEQYDRRVIWYGLVQLLNMAFLDHVTIQDPGGVNQLSVSASGAAKVDGSAVTQPVSGPLTDAQLRATAVPISGTITTTPSGTQNVDITGNTIGLLKPADTLTKVTTVDTITNPVAVTGTFFQATQPVSGPLTDTQLRATPVPVSGTVTTGGLTDTQLRASAVPVSLTSTTISNFPATQPVSAVSLPLPTGAATSANQTTEITAIGNLLTDTQLRATPVPVSGTVTTGGLTDTQLRASAVPVSAASLPLPTGASTSALQTTGNTSVASIDTKVPSGLTVKAASTAPVAADQSLVVTISPNSPATGVTGSVSVTNFPATQAISAVSLPLPTGAATSALQSTQDTSINSLLKPASTLAAVTTVGAVTAITNALPTGANVIGGVTQSGTWNVNNVSGTISLPTGASTSVLQTTQDTSINTLLKPASTLAAVTTVGTVTAVTAITNALPTGTNTIGNVNQTLATAGFSKTTDGTNTAGVTAASTSPVAATPASVVTISPNTSTVATAIAKAQNAAFAASDVGISALGVRRDVNTVASTAGNYANITVDQFGNMKAVGDIGSGVADTTTSFPVKTGAVFNATLPTVTTGQRVDNQADSRGRMFIALDSGTPAYSAAVTFTPAAAATNIFSIIGSATKKVIITRLGISATATNQGVYTATINKCSTADTGGTSTVPAAVPHDATSAAATASCKAYTANPTIGTVIGAVRSIKQVIPQLGVLATTQFPAPFIFDFDGNSSQSMVLNGVAQQLSVNLNGGTFAGNSFSMFVQWVEE